MAQNNADVRFIRGLVATSERKRLREAIGGRRGRHESGAVPGVGGSGMKFLELFAGIGGFRRGLESLGHQCVGYVEWDKFARKSYEAIWPESREEWTAHDITTVTDDALRRLSGSVGGVDLIAFGSPCQDVSVAGRRAGFTSEGELTRSGLFFEAMRFARLLKPRYLVMENVVGLLSSNNGRDMAAVIANFHEVGMESVEWDVLNATEFEIPQNRERVFIVGARDGSGRKVFPLQFDGSEDTAELKELTTGVADAHRVYDSDGIARTLKSEGGGLGAKTGLYMITDDGPQHQFREKYDITPPLRAQGGGSTPGVFVYGVMVYQSSYRSGEEEWDEVQQDVAPTLRAQWGHQVPAVRAATIKSGLMHSRGFETREDGLSHCIKGAGGGSSKNFVELEGYTTRIRRLTPREVWRLMGRADWEFERAQQAGVSDSQLYKQAGNSLIPQIVEAIGRKLTEEPTP